MRLWLVTGAFMLASCAAPAAADLPYDPVEDRRAVEDCIAAIEDVEALHEACKGVVAIPCTHSGEYGGATFELVLCNSREADAWQAAVDVRMARLAQEYADRAQLLRAAQAAWTAWREAECSFHRADAYGGSSEQVIVAQCFATLTADRGIELTRWERLGPRY